MKTLNIVFLLLTFSFFNPTFADVYTTGSAVDSNGNIIVIGYCFGNVKIAGEQFNITSPSAFILKLNSEGEMIWVKFLNSSSSMKAKAVDVDSTGSIYIIGDFSGTINFGSNPLTSQGIDIFISKLDLSGNVLWVRHGTSSIDTQGYDITVKGNLIFACGYGKPISFNSLNTTGGGFTVIYDYNGNIINLFKTREISYKINIDNNNDIIISGSEYMSMPVPGFWPPSLSKYSQDGNLIWVDWLYVQFSRSACSDKNNNVYSLEGYSSVQITKYDTFGNILSDTSFGPSGSHVGKEIIFSQNNTLAMCGAYSSGFQFGNSTLQSEGLEDFFIAFVDTNLNPVWIKHGGGLYKDELNSLSIMMDGSILSAGNFRGTITFDSLATSGGTGINDQWAGVVKLDSDGNLLWLIKIAENFVEPSGVIWLPLENGNTMLKTIQLL